MQQLSFLPGEMTPGERSLIQRALKTLDRHLHEPGVAFTSNARAPVYTVTHGDIDLGLLFNTNGFMLEENVVSTKPRFHFIADKQNDISSIVVELDYPVDISEVSRVMENLLLESADKLLRYKGMLWIDGEANRLLFQGVQRLYSADWDRPWGDEKPHSTMVFIGIQLPEDEIRAAFAGLRK